MYIRSLKIHNNEIDANYDKLKYFFYNKNY